MGYPFEGERVSAMGRADNFMTKAEFLRDLENQLEVPEGSLNGKQALRDLSTWDSMAGLLFIALADEKLGVLVSGDQIARSKTIDDLMSLLGDRLTALT
jgi:acyl carrier protein